MAPPYTRRIDKPTGKVYIDPNAGIPTQIVPAGGLTPDGLWVPLNVLDDGTVVTIAGSDNAGVPYFDDAIQTITPGVQQTLLDVIVPDATKRYLSQLIIATRVTGVFWIMAAGAVIGSGRTGPGEDSMMSFYPPRPIMAGTEYMVLFTSRLNAPVQSVECYLQASDVASS